MPEIGAGVLYVVLILAVSMAVAATLAAMKVRERWSWLRYGAISGLVLLGVAMALSEPFPDGLGIEACGEQLSQAGEAVLVCEKGAMLDPPFIMLFLAIGLLLAPDVAEFSIPGFLSLKRQVKETEEKVEEIEERFSVLVAPSQDVRANMNQVVSVTSGELPQTRLDPRNYGLMTAFVVLLEGLIERVEQFDDGREFEARIYVPMVTTRGRLAPLGADLSAIDEADLFEPGNGATGQAFSEGGDPVLVFGEHVHNAEYGLTAAQQEHFADLTAVGAAPLLLPDGRVVGALTMATRDAAPNELGDDRDYEERWAEHLASEALVVVAGLDAMGYSWS